MAELDLSPGEWAVLGVVAEGPTHGFDVARDFAPDGPIGRVWTLPRPVVYQLIKKLLQVGLIEERSTQRSDRGPVRTIVAATPAGRRALKRWLSTPVDHVRDVRSLLLLKLALLDRAGRDHLPLVEAQRQRIAAQVESLRQARRDTEGFERVLAEWRLASSRATADFLDALTR